jgi:hypothetical protein
MNKIEIENFLNPKKKLNFMMNNLNETTHQKSKIELDMNTSKASKKIFSERPNTVYPKHLRPLTGFTNPIDENSKSSRQNFPNANRPFTTNTLLNSNFNKSNLNIKERENVEIEDKDRIDCKENKLK